MLEERQAALFRGRVVAIVALAVTAVAAGSLDMSGGDRWLAVAACAAAVALHAALHWSAARWPRRLLLAVDAGLVVDALLVLALALLSGGVDSPALWLLPPMALAATLALSAASGLKAAVLAALVAGGVIAVEGESTPVWGWLGPLVMTAIVVVVAVGLSSVNERELRRRGERMTALHAASVAFARATTPEEVETIAQGTASALLPDWDVTVARGAAAAEERTWREGDRVALEVPIASPGAPGEAVRPLGVIRATRDIPRLGPPRVRGQQLLALRTLAGAVAAALGQQELMRRLERQSLADALTGLGNRRAFDEALEVELKRARRAGGWVGLVMMDVDHFKRFNDQHGHQAGDDALVTVGRVLTSVARAEDRACRVGGEEFALLLPGADERAAAIVAERVRRDVEARAPAAGPVTISLGVAASRGDDGQALLATADARLYAAKEAGRNRVVGAPATTPG